MDEEDEKDGIDTSKTLEDDRFDEYLCIEGFNAYLAETDI